MPVSKKRYPKKGKKRTKRIKPDISNWGGYTVHFDCGFEISYEAITALHDNSVKYYHNGRKDKENSVPALTLNEFTKKIVLPKTGLPSVTDTSIIRAQHSQYIDGYNGAEYRERVTFERDY